MKYSMNKAQMAILTVYGAVNHLQVICHSEAIDVIQCMNLK
jgi:hypothetical protein